MSPNPNKAKRPVGETDRFAWDDDVNYGAAAGDPLEPQAPSMRTAGPTQGQWGGRGSQPRPTAQRLAVAVSRDRERVAHLSHLNPRKTPTLPQVQFLQGGEP